MERLVRRERVVIGQLLAAMRSENPRERATAIAITVSTLSAIGLIVGTFGGVVAVYRNVTDATVLLAIVVFAVCWMAFVLLGDVVLMRLFQDT
jgi:hypothetical protein